MKMNSMPMKISIDNTEFKSGENTLVDRIYIPEGRSRARA